MDIVAKSGVTLKAVAAFINGKINAAAEDELYVSVAELKYDLIEQFGFTDVQVRYNFSNDGLEKDSPEEYLILGSAVTVYDDDGLCGIYTYGDYK